MQRIAGMTVLHAAGVPEAMYNGQRDKMVDAIREEMERQKAAMCAEMEHMKAEYEKELQVERDRADINTKKRYERNAEKLNAFFAPITKRSGPVRRVFRRVGNVYALIVGTMMCLPEIGETLGLWEIIREEDEHEDYERASFADHRQRSKEPRRRAGIC